MQVAGSETKEEFKEIIAGKVEKRIYFSFDNNFVVFKLNSPSYDSSIVCTGYLPPHLEHIDEDIQVEVEGQWKTGKYGRQFQFSKIRIAGEDEYSFFMRLIKGLGPKLIERIKERFSREEIIAVLEKSPERLMEVPGIGPQKLKEIWKSWQDAKRFRDLYSFFERQGAIDKLSVGLVIKIYKFFEEKRQDPISAILENPYQLTNIKGIGFKTADRIALSIGFPPNSKARIVAGIQYVLNKKADEGHTYLFVDQLKEAIREELEQAEEIEAILNETLKHPIPKVVLDMEEGRIGLDHFWLMEEFIRRKVLSMAVRKISSVKRIDEEKVKKLILSFEERIGFPLTGEQKNFLMETLALERQIYALTGYAGTGKTTVLKALLYALFEGELAYPEEVVCCAFTGMAARRLKEVTGFPYCKTIHSLLEYNQGGFQRNENNPLDQRIVILDEASMVNVYLFYALLRALRPDALFIVVGDPAQLPPIGPGNVFSDLLSGRLLPGVMLTEIKRQSLDSAITLIANEIRKGIFPKDFIYSVWNDFVWTEVRTKNIWEAKKRGASKREIEEMRWENNRMIKDELISQVKNLFAQGYDQWQIQVLSPMRIGPLGTYILNEELRKIFNPSEDGKKEVEIRGQILRLGDKIINLENRDLPAMDFEDFKKGHTKTTARRILNGQLGTVVAFLEETKQVVAKMVDVENYVVFFDLDDFGRKIDLAYCLTVHKSQGSQYPFVLIPMTTSHWHMLNNQWLYTGLTRAYRLCALIGEKAAFKRAATNVASVKRQTWLSVLE